jgi:hypothetical protein
MDISSVSNASFSRSVTPAKSSSDRQSNDQTQATLVESKAQEHREHERAVQEKLQHSRDENQRRLDGRIISFGHEQQDDVSSQQNQLAYNRSRVNEAYSASRNERSDSYQENTERSQEQIVEAINIVV